MSKRLLREEMVRDIFGFRLVKEGCTGVPWWLSGLRISIVTAVLRLLLLCGFDPWTRNLHMIRQVWNLRMLQVWPEQSPGNKKQGM